ncbi:MAG: hypothetical protein JWQ04_1127 [Pedosphaera sp.]|nr:hypothetical protein [Pedosphaera sp.]
MANTLWDKIEAKFNELTAKLSPAQPAASAVDHSALISEFRSQLDGFKSSITAKDSEITKLNAAISGHADAIKAKDDKISILEAAQAAFDTKVQTAASAKAGAILAEVGQPPLKAGKDESPAAPEKKSTDGLTGLAKYQAAIRAEMQKNNPK